MYIFCRFLTNIFGHTICLTYPPPHTHPHTHTHTHTQHRSRQLENTLLMEAKTLEQKLSKQKRVLDKAAAFPEGDNSETGRLRQNLLTHQNELDQTEERIGKLEHEINL